MKVVRNEVTRSINVSGDARSANISGLTPSTQYNVQVAIVNDVGIGTYSVAVVYETEGEHTHFH